MLLKSELPKMDHIEHFKYLQEISKDIKYKIPYFNHSLRLSRLIIDNEVVEVYLSTWSLKIL